MSKNKKEELELQEETVLEQETSSAEEEAAEKYNQLNDRYLRLMAEFDNFKKRTVKEKADIYTNAAADAIEAVLPVADTIIRAIEMDKDNEGLRLIEKQLSDALKNIGVETIPAVGENFDPEFHNAIFHVEDESVAENTVVEEFAKGYKYKSKVIRHSMVKVAN